MTPASWPRTGSRVRNHWPCTHDGGRLTGGTRDGCRIVCPRHGAAFDLRTGAGLAPPAYGPLTTFAARTVDDRIEIAIPDDF